MKLWLTIFTSLLLTASVSAQSDSGYLDIGRIRLKEDFTQVTRIKAEDISRLSFLSLLCL